MPRKETKCPKCGARMLTGKRADNFIRRKDNLIVLGNVTVKAVCPKCRTQILSDGVIYGFLDPSAKPLINRPVPFPIVPILLGSGEGSGIVEFTEKSERAKLVREFRRRVDEGFRATMKKAGVSEERIQEFYRKREERERC